MKAIVLTAFGDSDNFTECKDHPAPVPGEQEVLVKIKAVGFNPVDYQMRQGKSEKKKMTSPVLGREFSGIVVRTGKNPQKFRKGMAVFAASGSMGSNGTYAEYISVPENILAVKPANLSFEEAAAVPLAGLTAMQACDRLNAGKNDRLFITGAAGGVGLALIKLLLFNGIRQIVATAGNAESRRQLITAGLPNERIIDYREEGLLTKIAAANGQLLFDHCIDLVGGDISELCARLLVTNGKYVDITALATPQAREILFDKAATVLHISNFAYARAGNTAHYGHTLQQLSELLEAGAISPPAVELVGDLSVATIKKAHHLLENNLTKGKKLVMAIPAASIWPGLLVKAFYLDFAEQFSCLHLVK